MATKQSNRWFRLYSELLTDPKVQMMSEANQRRLIMIFCMRCSNDLVTLHDEEIAFQLRVSLQDLSDTKAEFIKRGFIDESWNVLNWDKRQFVSDSSAARVARHREKKRSEKKQAGNVTVTTPDTEQIQNIHTSLRSVCESAHAENVTPPVETTPAKLPSSHDSGIPVPDDMQPERKTIADASSLGLDVWHERDRFVAYYQARAEIRADLKAWQAQFRKWVLDQHQFNADRAKVTDAKVKAISSQSSDSRQAGALTLGVGSQYLEGGPLHAIG